MYRFAQAFQVGHGIGRRHQPAKPPTGHAEILGKTIEDESRVVDLQHARRIHAVSQAVIDLIHHQVPLAFTGSLGQAGQFIAAQHRAGRVGRRGHQAPTVSLSQ